HTLVASRMVSGFGTFGRLTTTDWCNEAETGSLALRLASSPSRSSTGRLPATPPSRLHGERAIAMVSTFQLTRSARLNLADRRHQLRGKLGKTWRQRRNGCADPWITAPDCPRIRAGTGWW